MRSSPTTGAAGASETGSDSGTGQSSSNIGSSGDGSNPNGSDTGSDDTSTAQIQVVSTGRFTVELAVDSADVDGVAVGQSVTLTPSTSSSSRGFPGGPGRFFVGGDEATAGATKDDSSTDDAGSGSDSGSGPVTGETTATGTVADVGKIADASSGVATYPVTITFDASPDDFYIGSTVTGDIATNTRDNVVQVSSIAITTTNGVSTVTVATDGTTTGPTETRTVTTGLTANGSTEITSGLQAGENVVITITRPGGGGFSPPSGDGPSGFRGGPPGAVTESGG